MDWPMWSTGGDEGTGEDVAVDPGFGAHDGAVAADGVEEAEALGAEAAVDGLHKGAEVFVADVFEHADRDDAVEGFVDLAEVLEADLDGEVGAGGAGPVVLLGGEGDAGDVGAVALGHEAREAAPAAADVEDGHAGVEFEFAADEVELGLLGLVEGAGAVAPEGAGVDHAAVEHGLVELVAAVVVAVDVVGGAAAVLEVGDAGPEAAEPGAPVVAEGIADVGVGGAGGEFVEGVAVPPALDVGLAEAEGALGEDAAPEAGVVDAEIPRAVAVDADIRPVEQFPEAVDIGRHCIHSAPE